MSDTRGGGKTDGVLGKWALKERRYGSAFNAIMFRKTTVSAEDAIERSHEIYAPLGARFNASRLRWRMPNGGRIGFAYLETVKDADQYQGRIYESPDPINRLNRRLMNCSGIYTRSRQRGTVTLSAKKSGTPKTCLRPWAGPAVAVA
jgi:hypothetical protein